MKDLELVEQLEGKTVAFAGSGGLDSMTCTRFLKDCGVGVVVISADLGQPDEQDIGDIEKRMLACGVDDFVMLPLQDSLAEAAIRLVQGGGKYEGGYWNTTGLARHVIVEGIVKEMNKRNLTILAHGCTGRGNDQFRFQYATHHIDPSIQLYAPWRDKTFLKRFGGREEMIEYCESHGLPIRHSKSKPFSTDANLLGLTHEAGILESLSTSMITVEPEMVQSPFNALDESEIFEIRFEKGYPVRINGAVSTTLEAFKYANMIGGRHGVGIRHVVENRIVPFKSRGIYEQPGIELIGECYSLLLQLLLDPYARELYEFNAQKLGKAVYYGAGFDLAARMALCAVSPVTEIATGTIRVRLFKGNIMFESASEVPHSLYDEEATSMENTEGGFDHHDSAGMVRIGSQAARIHAKCGLTRNFLSGI